VEHGSACRRPTIRPKRNPVLIGGIVHCPMTVPDLTRLIQNQESSNAYTCYHAPRYAVCLNLVRRYLVPASTTPTTGQAARARRQQEPTRSGCRALRVDRPDHTHLRVPVDSLGFEPDGPSPGGGQHYSFDLNRAQRRETWRPAFPCMMPWSSPR
jgi:hypothetical protein